MQLSKFTKDAGFKILALSGLSSPQYAILLYLINCAASGMDDILTTHAEFASLMGYDEDRLREALLSLVDKNMIRLLPGEPNTDSVKISFQFEVCQWNIGQTQNLTPRDALVFPFMSRKGVKEKQGHNESPTLEGWERILNAYMQEQEPNLVDEVNEARAAHLLAETHPVGQTMMVLKHFGKRIKSLSLLASSWQHFLEVFEKEVHKVDDLDDARKKHQQLDEKLRIFARKHLSTAPENAMSEDEIAVLKVIAYHQHPRRQLYWAYQFHDRYPRLESFFQANAELMLSVTTHGTIVKKCKPDKKDKS